MSKTAAERTPKEVIKELRAQNKALRMEVAIRQQREGYALRQLDSAKTELLRLLAAHAEVAAWTGVAWGWADRTRRVISVLREAVEIIARGTVPDMDWGGLLDSLKESLRSTHLGTYPDIKKLAPNTQACDWSLGKASSLLAVEAEDEEDEEEVVA